MSTLFPASCTYSAVATSKRSCISGTFVIVALDKQQLLAQTLAQQASTMQPAQNMASPWGSVAQVAQGAAAGYMNQQNQATQQALQRQKMYAMAQMLQGGFNTSQLPDAPRE